MKIVFLSTRIAGNDGVSLEAVRWRRILEGLGHKVTFVAGELDRKGILLPELHFQKPGVVRLHDAVISGENNYRQIEKRIFEMAGKIEGSLREMLNNGKKPDLLITANVFSLPMHFPLAVALSRVIDDVGIPTIARHHDFWWERERFLKSSMFPFFRKYFPPRSKNVKHVVINSVAQKELRKRMGFDSVVIPDTFDFNSCLDRKDNFSGHFRQDLGISEKDIVFIQATRIIPRKRVEISIKLLEKLNSPGFVLLVAGRAGDEGLEYEKEIKKMAKDSRARIVFAGEHINSRRKIKGGKRIYTLWDAFTNADIMVYPTEKEGFGNQFLEATFFKKPIIITPYEVYRKDIKPLGYSVVEIGKKVLSRDVGKVRKMLNDSIEMKKMTLKNFKISKTNFSFEATREKIKKLIF